MNIETEYTDRLNEKRVGVINKVMLPAFILIAVIFWFQMLFKGLDEGFADTTKENLFITPLNIVVYLGLMAFLYWLKKTKRYTFYDNFIQFYFLSLIIIAFVVIKLQIYTEEKLDMSD